MTTVATLKYLHEVPDDGLCAPRKATIVSAPTVVVARIAVPLYFAPFDRLREDLFGSEPAVRRVIAGRV